MKTDRDIHFQPPIAELLEQRSGRLYTALCGPNNSGKSLILKSLRNDLGRDAYLMGVNRFYHVYYFTPAQQNPTELDQWNNQYRSDFRNVQHNLENNYMTLENIISRLKDAQRDQLFELCSRLLGNTITLKREDPDNELSMRYIDMDGYNVSVGSTGTRLLLTILGICLDSRFRYVLIDEPELGLGPRIQATLSKFMQTQSEREVVFPHLEQIFVATHSHLFLDRSDIASNFIVEKKGSIVEVQTVGSVQQFHRLQFNLLGNELEAMFLPSAIVIVEGTTDHKYIERVVQIHFPDRKVTVLSSQGDPKKRVHSIQDTFGGLHRSPFTGRLFVVLDSVHQKDLRRGLERLGLSSENTVVWDRNGIEYLYPRAILARIFQCSEGGLHRLNISSDVVEMNGIRKRKTNLCDEVCEKLSKETIFPEELNAKLLEPLRAAMA